MFASTRQWFKRNRTPLAIGAGVVGAGYVATQYVLRKLNDARERMSSDRIAKENLRRRFEQNQEDCTFTVLALLPTATTNILEALNTERITYEIQQMKSPANRKKSISSLTPSSISEVGTMDDDGRSMISGFSVQSEGGAYPSFLAPGPLPSVAEGESAGDASQQQQEAPKKPRKTKRQLWDDLKISSITRSFTLIYILGLLTMLTRIQLNLLGRRSYLSSVVSLATGSAREGAIALENNDDDGDFDGEGGQAYGSDFEVNRKYLTFSWWLLNRGWVDVMQRVESAVRQVFGPLSPRDTITFDAFTKLTREVRTIIEGSTSFGTAGATTQWLPFLLPPQNMEDFVLRESGILLETNPQLPTAPTPEGESTISLRRLLDETADLIESPAFSSVLTQLLDEGFTTLLDRKLTVGAFETPSLSAAIPQLVPEASATAGAGEDVVTSTTLVASSSDLHSNSVHAARQSIDIERPVTRAVLLPKILSILTRQAHAIGNGMPNEYLQAMEQVRDLEGFAAVVYSSNWQAEIASEEYAGSPAGGPSAAAAATARDNRGRKEKGERMERGTVEELAVLVDSLGPGVTGVEESLVVVDPNPDPTAGFDSAWERAMSASQAGSRGPSFEDRR